MSEQNQTVDSAAQPADNPTIEDIAAQLDSLDRQDADAQNVENPSPDDGPESQTEPDAVTETSGADEDAPDAAQKLSAKDVAEKLGIGADELYGAFEVSLGDGQSMTLSEIKHRTQDVLRADAMLAEARQQKSDAQLEVMQQRRIMQKHMQRVGYQPTEDDIQADEAEVEAYHKLQERLAVEYMPEWKHEGTRQADEKLIDAELERLQFSPAERKLMLDARLLMAFRELGQLRQQLSDVAKRYKRDKAPKTPKPTTRTGNAVTDIQAKVQKGEMTRQQAVDALGRQLG